MISHFSSPSYSSQEQTAGKSVFLLHKHLSIAKLRAVSGEVRRTLGRCEGHVLARMEEAGRSDKCCGETAAVAADLEPKVRNKTSYSAL